MITMVKCLVRQQLLARGKYICQYIQEAINE